tara:strand:+ start:208 stop:546 length:339 start_codon:yes stop_codon:yes gene_type:complete
MLLSKTFFFKAKHKLKDAEGQPLHEHFYKLMVEVESKVNDIGMIIDTRTLTTTVEKSIIAQLDKSFLNDYLPQPTLENITVWIWKELKPYVKHMKRIRLFENRTLFVEYEGK